MPSLGPSKDKVHVILFSRSVLLPGELQPLRLLSATVAAQCYSCCSVLQLLLSAAAYCSVLQITAQSYKLLLLLQFSGRALVWKRLETVKRVFSYDL